MKTNTVAIIGAGPAGTASALYLLEEGIQPVIFDKDPFPRYHIGESLTGECAGRLRELGLESKMNAANYPVKRGVRVYGTEGKNGFWVGVQKRNKDNQLVPTTTWQVRRSTFDKMLLDTAVERGAKFHQAEVISPLMDGDRVSGLQFRTKEGSLDTLKTDVVLDASGQRTFLATRGNLTSCKERGRYDKQIAIFSQVRGAICGLDTEGAGDTIIFYKQKHHWSWFIPIDEDIVSVGVVVPSDYFKAQQCSKLDFLRQELHTLNPELTKRLPILDFVEPVRAVSNYSYEIKQFTGKGFLCVGDSHRFVDPIFSFGVHFGISEGKFAAQAIKKYIEGEMEDAENPFSDYQTITQSGQEIVQNLVDCFWDFPVAFLYYIQRRYTDGITDIFSGRIYGKSVPHEAVNALRRTLATATTQKKRLEIRD